MAIQTHQATNYTVTRSLEVFGAEGIQQFAYVDSLGIVTIGYGLNLRVHGWFVLEALAVDVREQQLSGDALKAEQGFINRIKDILNGNYTPDNTSNNAALAALNVVLAERAASKANTTCVFAGISGRCRALISMREQAFPTLRRRGSLFLNSVVRWP